ncbi:MAG: pyrroline-5-carboxylate reductase [Syntrophales bacterium]|nr:pyrroline-5-carboxylate reductase [Syntrophales bacterium]
MLKGKKIGFIGGGKMGGVLIGSVLSHGLLKAGDLMVSDASTERREELRGLYGVYATNDNREIAGTADLVVLAVKPQNMAEVLEEISGAGDRIELIVSIAAGIPTGFIESYFRKGIRVIRAMPNTPAMVGEGVTALACGGCATEKDLALARMIFDSVGITVTVEEKLMDAVTGLSGSGPAYGFVVIEALSDAGVRMGLSKEIALKLSAQTILGAARLCLVSGKHPAELRNMVTSPGGTTIAGLKALEKGKIRATLMAAVEAATVRARELGEGK